MSVILRRMNGDGTEDINNQKDDRICRDFLRNVCKRGKRCKYLHLDKDVVDLNFCHDFQNKQCARVNCRFLHCSRDEEEKYRNTGELPVTVRKICQGEPPVCKDFLKGNCRRSNQCKFKHVLTATEIQIITEPMVKRRRIETEFIAMQVAENRFNFIEEENLLLKRELDELRRQMHALAAANELLLEQNARLRLSKGPVVSLPAVITNSASGAPVTITTAVAPCSVAQVSLTAAPIVTVAQSLNTCTPMSISAASAPLVSFPIVTRPHSIPR